MRNFQAGDKILMEFSTFGDRLLSVVNDVKEDGSLLVYSPMPEPVLQRLRTDKKVFVRYVQNGVLRGFRSQVLNEVESSENLLVIKRPDTVFNAEDRGEIRYGCSFPATVVDENRAAKAILEDISASYTRVRFLVGDVPFLEEVGGMVRLTFHPFEMGEGINVMCMVKNVFRKDHFCYAILEFNQEEKEIRNRIKGFIEAQTRCGIPPL